MEKRKNKQESKEIIKKNNGKNKKEVEMEKEKVLLKKEKDVVLFVKSEKAKAIKLVNLDLSEYIMLNEPMKVKVSS